MIKRLFVVAFGLGFGASAWQNVPPVDNATGQALGFALAVALVVAFIAGRRFGPERDQAAVTSAVAAAVINARMEAAAHARASATQLVYVAGSSEGPTADVLSLDDRRASSAGIDPMEAHALVLEHYGLDLPPEDAADLLNEALSTTSKDSAPSGGRYLP